MSTLIPTGTHAIEITNRLSELCDKATHDELRMIMGELKFQLAELRMELSESVQETEMLKLRLARLEEQNGRKCPRCSENSYRLASSERDKIFSEVGGCLRTFKGTSCGFSEQAVHIPGLG